MMICPQPPPTVATSRRRLILAVMLMALWLEKPANGQQPEPIDFIRQVAPILQQRCLNCHGARNAEGGLRLHQAAATRRGGDSGAVLVAGKSDQSELLRRLKTNDVEERMPLKLKPLTREEVQVLVAWIDQGANWPANYTIAPPAKARAEQAARHWAFQPLQQPSTPGPMGSAKTNNAIDRFILVRLQQEKVQPSPAADRVTLIRRVTLDLIGLPPTPAEVAEFLKDSRPDAYQRLVERLLASPHYGERWARPWMDLCHYADTDGYLTDQQRPVAWRYRDWLVRALNQDMPFDQFTIEQLAGDLLPGATVEQKLATGFLRQTLSNREGGAEPEEFRVKQVVDRTEMVGTSWLGLTVGCARCHDHKYDPISQGEFYQLYACFNNADEINIDAPLPTEAVAWRESRSKYQRRRRALIDPQRIEVENLQKRWEVKCLDAWENPGQDALWDRQWELLGLVWGGDLGEGQMEGVEIAKLPWEKRSERQRDDLLDYFLRHASVIDAPKAKELKVGELQGKLQALKKEFPRATRAPIMRAAQTHRDNYVHERGEFRDRGQGVQPGVPNCIPSWRPQPQEDPRLTLSRWLVDKKNPLTARVTVNRMWEQFFGRGLVLTTEDFGLRGETPSHPELLDWLAAEFMRSGWDVKAMHRLIVTSATYRQSSAPRPELLTRDPGNSWLARQNSLRVSAETVRDMGLAVSGLWHRPLGGPSVKPPQPERVTMEAFGRNDWKPSPAPDRYRRGLYTFIIRTAPFAQSATFDAPNPNQICTRRIRSNTPLQALVLLNDPVFYEMAQSLAVRVLRPQRWSVKERVDDAFQLCLARRPSLAERERLLTYLDLQYKLLEADAPSVKKILGAWGDEKLEPIGQAAWTNLCSVLLNLHEFITRD
jgi:hypothetical protein